MNQFCSINNEFYSNLDLFGKKPELYFEGKPKKSSCIGLILTFIYIALYIAFLIYKLVIMIKREKVTFYDTYSHEELPSIELTNEIFYGAFSLGGMINEELYIPKVELKNKTGDILTEIEIEKCKLEKFGSKHQDIFKNYNLDNYYCLKNITGLILGGNVKSESHIYLSIKIYPCHKMNNGINCKSELFQLMN